MVLTKIDSEGKEEPLWRKAAEGYGCSIRLKDKKVILRGGTDVFTGKAETEEWFVPQIPYERIVVAGKGYLSTDAISLLSQKNVNVILLDSVSTNPEASHGNIGQEIAEVACV